MLLGAFLTIKQQIEKDSNSVHHFQKLGEAFFQESAKDKIPVVLKLKTKPDITIRTKIRSHGLKWNNIRKEWSGYITNKEKLQKDLKDHEFTINTL